jgi:predicted Zn-dependent protease
VPNVHAILWADEFPADGRSVLQLQRTIRSRLSLFFALILASCCAQTILGQAPGESTSTEFEALAKSAAAAREAGNAGEAIRDYQRALEMRPSWEEGWWFLGTLQYDGDRYAEAIFAFQKLAGLVPNAGPVWNFLGLCEYETKDYANSLEHLKKGLALGDGDDPEIARVSKYHLGLLLIRNGEFDAASALLAKTFGQSQMSAQIKVALGLAMLGVPLLPEEVDPSRDALVHAAGEAAAGVAQNDSEKTLTAFPLLLAGYPNTPYLHYVYGKALASAARYEEALTQQKEEARVSPESALPQIEISLLEVRLQRPAKALEAAEDGVRLAPESSAAHRALGEALGALGRKERAEKELAAAERLATEKPPRDAGIVGWYARRSEAVGQTNSQEAASQQRESAGVGFEELSRRAGAAQTAGNKELAMQSYEQALQARPDWNDGRWNLAMLDYSTGRYREAISELEKWLQHKPDFGTAWAVMGLSEFEMKDYSDALIHLERGAELGLGGSPEAVRLAKYRLALLFNRERQFERATETLGSESGSGPFAKEIQFTLGMALLRMPLLPEEVPVSQHALVQSAGEIAALLESSKYDQAFPKFQALLKEYPSAPFLHYAYGTALAALSQYDEAEIQLRKEAQISSASELPYVRLASLSLKKHRAAEALPDAEHAVQFGHNSAEAHYVLGRTWLELGENQTAVQELETASKFAPGSPEVHFNLAKAYAKTKQPEKAEQERAIFARLNALAEKQRSLYGNQAYRGSHDAEELSPTRIENNKPSAVEHPQ